MARSDDLHAGHIWWRLAAVVLAIIVLNVLGGLLVERFEFALELRPSTSDLIYRMMVASAITYVVAMTLPFVPGIEIGLAIMLMTGPEGVLFVYVCTLLALSMAFAAGRFVPMRLLARFFGWLRLARARRLIEDLASRPASARLDDLMAQAPDRGWTRRLLRHRHLAVAVLINLPGNAVIGGAGGIAMIAGMSHLFRFPAFLLTMAVAITPVPILLMLTR